MKKFKQLIAQWLNIEPVIQIQKEIQKEIVIQKIMVLKDAPQWTAEHAGGLNLFLKAPVGKDLMCQMDAVEVVVNSWAVSSLNGSREAREFRAGVAYGMAVAFNKIKRMSDVQLKNETEEATLEELDAIVRDRLSGY